MTDNNSHRFSKLVKSVILRIVTLLTFQSPLRDYDADRAYEYIDRGLGRRGKRRTTRRRQLLQACKILGHQGFFVIRTGHTPDLVRTPVSFSMMILV